MTHKAAGTPRKRINSISDVRDALQVAPEHRLPRDFVLETIVLRMPSEDYERLFQVWIGWARYGDLFAYDEIQGMVELQ